MTALMYFLGFLTGLAAAAVAYIIIKAKKRRINSEDTEQAYLGLINY